MLLEALIFLEIDKVCFSLDRVLTTNLTHDNHNISSAPIVLSFENVI